LLFVRFAAKPRGALESPRVLRGVKKLFLQVVPVVSLYTLYTFYTAKIIKTRGVSAAGVDPF
jgi:hypothetical protein